MVKTWPSRSKRQVSYIISNPLYRPAPTPQMPQILTPYLFTTSAILLSPTEWKQRHRTKTKHNIPSPLLFPSPSHPLLPLPPTLHPSNHPTLHPPPPRIHPQPGPIPPPHLPQVLPLLVGRRGVEVRLEGAGAVQACHGVGHGDGAAGAEQDEDDDGFVGEVGHCGGLLYWGIGWVSDGWVCGRRWCGLLL